MAFSLGNKKMVLDRGRYKEAGSVGSRSEAKGSGFLSQARKAFNENQKQKVRLSQEKGKAMGIDARRAAKSNPSVLTKPANKVTPKPQDSLGKRLSRQPYRQGIKTAEAEIMKQYK